MKPSLVALVVAVSVALACSGGDDGGEGGGGGGGGGSSITVTYVPAAIDAHAMVGYPAPVTVRATLSPEPTTMAYPVIVADHPHFMAGTTTVTQDLDGSYSATIYTTSTLTQGVHAGTLTLRLCKDSNCTQQYALTGASVAYSITVEPPPTLTVSVGGNTLTPISWDVNGAPTYGIDSGVPVTITASMPVTWANGSSWAVTLSSVSQTETTWTGTPSASSGHWFEIRAYSATYAPNSNSVWFDIN
ncbi:hypothetical protein [Anaeromyxobacter sp. Fw109-5]|uniref:hypothetical protein n=1 Tax=Anaeromyxobacter sp. (strain Fw109-5) TaxID=404589 RepID=UPI0000ED6E52|nr:hypothetical protein [Anaeromyxobacter sp. Fw109-5]ABS28110.1 hypothetical protein Anae109_3931 [Anaeromyxobacter sp. Fw109-5]